MKRELTAAEIEFWDNVDAMAQELMKWMVEHSRLPDGSLDTITFGAAAAQVTGSNLSCLPHDVGWAGLRVVSDHLHDTYLEGRKVAREHGQDEVKH